jgi:NitT/TauT family transport system substrate-binding protein
MHEDRGTEMSNRIANFACAAIVGIFGTVVSAQAADKVIMGTGWLAQAEHGGFYQAVADGTYAKYGLDVSILMGGPQTPTEAKLIAGQIQFIQGGTLGAFDAVANNVPLITVAAIFQKDPQAILAHPDQGIEKIDDLAKLDTLFLAGAGYDTYFRWMKSMNPDFKDEKVKPYTFNPAPFIANPKSGQQAYITSEPFAIKKMAGWDPKAFLLADYGYAAYATTIETQKALYEKNPDLVKRFVEASIIGWYNYLYGDNKAANDLIKKDNPEMTDEQIAFSIAQLKKYEIVVGGDAATKGIGCMTDDHYKTFFDSMSKAGVLKADLDYKKAYTTEFVCKGLGKELAK